MTGVPIHGTGMTSDDIVKRAHDTLPIATGSVLGGVKIGSGVTVDGTGTISFVGGGGGGYVPVPGSPVKFVRYTAHDDGSSSGTIAYNLVLYDLTEDPNIPWIIDIQGIGRVVGGAADDVILLNVVKEVFLYPPDDLINTVGGGLPNNSPVNYGGATKADANAFAAYGISNGLVTLTINGMSTGQQMDWIIEVQLTPYPASSRPTTAIGL